MIDLTMLNYLLLTHEDFFDPALAHIIRAKMLQEKQSIPVCRDLFARLKQGEREAFSLCKKGFLFRITH